MKKEHYILFSEYGNKILTNPKVVPIGAIKISLKDLPKNVSPSFMKYDKETKKVVPLTLIERSKMELKNKQTILKEKTKTQLKPVLVGFMVGLILGALSVWQLFN